MEHRPDVRVMKLLRTSEQFYTLYDANNKAIRTFHKDTVRLLQAYFEQAYEFSAEGN